MSRTPIAAPVNSEAAISLSGGPTSQGGPGTVADQGAALQAESGFTWAEVFAVPPVRVGSYRTDDHRYYWNGQGPDPKDRSKGFPSVTTVIDVLHRFPVTNYREREAARAVIDNPDLFRDLHTSWDVDAALSAAQAIVNLERDTAADLGSSVHQIADMVARSPSDGLGGFALSPEQESMARAFLGFLGHYSASNIVSSEKAVYSLRDGYAGTYDLLMELPSPLHGNDEDYCPNLIFQNGGMEFRCGCKRELWLIEIKTSKGYYPEFGLQLAAYRWAEFIGLPDDPTKYPMPHVHRTGVLHLRPDQYPDTGWRLVEYPTTDRDYMAFCAALDLYQWKGEGRFTKSNLKKATEAGQETESGPERLGIGSNKD